MKKVISNDGTEIAYDQRGQGPAVILVDGALCYRSFGPMAHLAELLAPHFTVYNYDRRGRGDSSDTQPYSLEREVEDLEALRLSLAHLPAERWRSRLPSSLAIRSSSLPSMSRLTTRTK